MRMVPFDIYNVLYHIFSGFASPARELGRFCFSFDTGGCGGGTLDKSPGSGIINIAKADDVFLFSKEQIVENIDPQEVLDLLEQSEIGKNTLKQLQEMKVKPVIDFSKQYHTIRGYQQGNVIRIFMSNIANAKVAAQTIIHETTHLYYNIGRSQWAEAVCMANEKMFLTGRPLTISEKRYIIKLAKDFYPELQWLKGGYGHGRKK